MITELINDCYDVSKHGTKFVCGSCIRLIWHVHINYQQFIVVVTYTNTTYTIIIYLNYKFLCSDISTPEYGTTAIRATTYYGIIIETARTMRNMSVTQITENV